MGNDPRSIIYRAVALQYLAVLLGVAWWAATSSKFRGDPLAHWPTAGFLSVILLGIASYRAYTTRRQGVDPGLATTIACLACYAFLVILFDPFLWIEDRIEDVLCVAVILPPLLSIKPLVRSGAWLAVCGVVVFSTAAVACLLFNGTIGRRGIGFSGWWVD